MPGGKGNCAVIGCTNSSYRLNKWKKEICVTHNRPHQLCPCDRPFKLLFFPGKIRYIEQRETWIRLLRRETSSKSKWEPCDSDRVCSIHFIDGEPTNDNPNPSLKLGYDHELKERRRPLIRKSNQPLKSKKRKLESVNSEENVMIGDSNFSANTSEYVSISNQSGCSNDPTNAECSSCKSKDEMIKSLTYKIDRLRLSVRKTGFMSWKKITTSSPSHPSSILFGSCIEIPSITNLLL